MFDVYPALAQLAERFGIAQEFWDWKGRHVPIPAETIIEVLAAFDVDASTPQAAEAALAKLDEDHWRRALPPCTVVEEGQAVHVNVHVPAGTHVHVWVKLESGEGRGGQQVENWSQDRWIDGNAIGEATFFLGSDLPTGSHHIVVEAADGIHKGSLIVTPTFVGFPAAMRDQRIWGYGAQLYSVASTRSWGIGDLADLADLITWSGTRQFAGYVLINPLHAAEPVPPIEPSPYLPSSRRFINPIYIRPESIAEYATLGRLERQQIKALRKASREAAEASGIVDRNAIWPLKLEALRIIHKAGMRPARRIAYDDFRRREGIGLRNFALWSALSVTHGQHWPSWPEDLRRPSSPEVAAYAEEHAEQVDFFEWLQWVAQTQVSAAQTVADEVGMPVGIVTDLAVGVHRTGAETWMMPDVFAQGMSVGAPPDQYNQAGQDWGQPPWRPDKLDELAYAPFRAMVSAALRRVGGVRVDHIIGMFRLWWVPQGGGPTAGTYVRYDHDAMIGILLLEAHRAGAVVVGEDLGTVEPWVRDYLAERGIMGTSILWFEAGQQGSPSTPSGGASTAWRRSRRTTCRRRPATSPATTSVSATTLACSPNLSTSNSNTPDASRPTGWTSSSGRASWPTSTATTPARCCSPCTSSCCARRRRCCWPRSPTPSASAAPRTSLAPSTSTPTGACRWATSRATGSRWRRSLRPTCPSGSRQS